MDDIRVEYNSIPSYIVEDFGDIGNPIGVTINSNNEGDINYYEGGPPDIIIFVGSQLGEVISAGVLLPALYDLVKGAVLKCWKKFINYNSQKAKYDANKNFIALDITIATGKSIEFHLSGDMNEEATNLVLDKVFNYLRDRERLERHFNNPSYKDSGARSPKMRFRFNHQSGEWEPVNYAELRKRNEELLDKIRKLKS